MAHTAVKFLLENLSRLLKSNVDLISGAIDELKLLQIDVSLLEFFLEKASNYNYEYSEEKYAKEVVYDIEDAIDAYLTGHLETAPSARKLKGFIMRRNPTELAQQVRSLREDKLKPLLDEIIRVDFADMQIADRPGKSTVPEHRAKLKKVPSTMWQEGIVVLEDERQRVIQYLTQERPELDAITIVGMPGLGKTTLAWRIYHSLEIQYKFPTRIWVDVSRVLNTKDLFLNILQQLSDEDMSSHSDNELMEVVYALLRSRIFLLVLDDVRSVETWNAIRNALPSGNRIGKVLITSRLIEVGRHANLSREPHHLRFLTVSESWSLLQLEVFGLIGECPPRLEGIGQYIAQQCNGVPLAVVLVAGILLDQLTTKQNIDMIEKTWTSVSNEIKTFSKSRMGPPLDFVTLSYNGLRNELRECFLYLGVFPENYEIPAWTLCHLWIAEGFIQPKQGYSLEEAAQDNLEELIDRNLVTVDKTNPNGQVKTCRVYDVLKAFCSSIASVTDQNLFQEITSFEGASELHKYRRLCIHSDPAKFLSTEPKGPHVRSFLCFDKEPSVLNPKYISSIPNGFKLLRVLDSSKSIKFHQFPKGVTKLIHLRYITLCGDNLRVLPEPISELWNLQTIVVDTNSRQLTVRSNIWKMVLLRHLKTKASIILDIQEEPGEAGENLQTLTRLSPEHCTDYVFSKARNLKTLGIFGKLSSLADAKSLTKLNSLEKLKLVNDLFYEASASALNINGLPQPICFPPNLKRLTLTATFSDWEHMSTLAQIETLEILKLKDNAFTGKLWRAVGDTGSFRRLHFLLIAETDLVYWEASADYFPVLDYLVLKNCQKLDKIPQGVAKSLKKLEIGRLGKSAVESARKIETDRRHGGGFFKLSVGPGCE